MKMKVKVNKDKCPKKHPCSTVEICPNKAISQEGFNAPLVDEKNVSDVVNALECVIKVPFTLEIEGGLRNYSS